MEYTQEQLSGIKADFAKRRRRQLIAAVLFTVGAVMPFILSNMVRLENPLWLAPWIGGVLALAVFSIRNWRCPACHKYLGRNFNPNFCPHCGVALR